MDKYTIDEHINRSLNLSIYDGVFASIMASLTSGIFLVGFALHLGATNLEIGFIASLPLFVNVFQLLSVHLLQQKNIKRKNLVIITAGISRTVWFVIILLPGLIFSSSFWALWIFMMLIGLSSLFGAILGPPWLSWMRDLVPLDIRGRYFAKRNRWCGLAVMLSSLIGAKFIDFWKTFAPDNVYYGFLIVFGVGTLFGLISLFPLSLIPDYFESKPESDVPFRELIRIPLRDKNFKRLLIYSMSWSFAINLAAPFFTVYMLEDLKISYTTISLFAIVEATINIGALRMWGRLTDRFGNKPVLSVCGTIGSLTAFMWIFSSPEKYYIIPLIYAVNGFAFSAIGLAANNILLKLSPQKNNVAYLSVFATLTSLAAAIGPLFGGAIGQLFIGKSLTIQLEWLTKNKDSIFSIFKLWHFHFLFILAGALRLITTSSLAQVKEVGEAHPREVIRILTNTRSLATMLGMSWFTNYFIEKPISIIKRIGEVFRDITDKDEDSDEKED